MAKQEGRNIPVPGQPDQQGPRPGEEGEIIIPEGERNLPDISDAERKNFTELWKGLRENLLRIIQKFGTGGIELAQRLLKRFNNEAEEALKEPLNEGAPTEIAEELPDNVLQFPGKIATLREEDTPTIILDSGSLGNAERTLKQETLEGPLKIFKTEMEAKGEKRESPYQLKKGEEIVIDGKKYIADYKIGEGGFAQVWSVLGEDGKELALKAISIEGDPDKLNVRRMKNEDFINSSYREMMVQEILSQGELVGKYQIGDKQLDAESAQAQLVRRHGTARIMPAVYGQKVCLGDNPAKPFRQMFMLMENMIAENKNRPPEERINNLETAIEENRLTEEQKMVAAHKIILALARIHTNGLAHRDIKPPNIMVDPAKPIPGREKSQIRVKIFDYATAEAASGHPFIDEKDLFIGTLAYKSPEEYSRIDKKEVKIDPQKQDIYALGVVLYKMFFGAEDFFNKGKIGGKNLDNFKDHIKRFGSLIAEDREESDPSKQNLLDLLKKMMGPQETRPDIMTVAKEFFPIYSKRRQIIS